MAHKGNPCPVFFRRDFNLNVNTNNAGFADRYLCGFHPLPPGDANIVDNHFFITGPGALVSSTSIEWNSPFELIPVFQFRMKLIAQINDGQHYFKGAELISKTGGTILAVHWADERSLRFPLFDLFTFVVVDFYDAAWFDVEPRNLFCFAYRMKYDGTPQLP